MDFPNIPDDMIIIWNELGTFPDLSTPTSGDDASQAPANPTLEAVSLDELLSLQYHLPAAPGTSVPRVMEEAHSDQELSNGGAGINLDLSNTHITVPAIIDPSPSSALVVGSTCPRCGQVHPRFVRAEACLNKSRDTRPFLCNGDCGEPGW